jgi:hypothetical protein
MNRTFRTRVTFALAGLLTASPSLLAREPADALNRSIAREAARLSEETASADDLEWGRVRTLSPGTSLVVVTVGPSSRKGALVSADDSVLRIDIHGQAETIDRRDVLSVTIAASGLGGNRFVAGALGAVAGGFAGYAFGYDHARGQKGIYRAVYVGMPIGIGVGAAAGALAAGRAARTIYLARRVSTP